MELASKIVLATKGEQKTLPTINALLVDLNWKTDRDLDLMVQFETKSGEKGLIYTDELPNGNLGDPNTTPFIVHSGDEGIGGGGDDLKHEQVKLMKMEDLAEAKIIALNFTDASAKNNDASFADDDAKVSIKGFGSDETQEFEVELNSPAKGHVAHICTIDNRSPMGATLTMEDAVYPFGEEAIAALPELVRLTK